METRAHFVLIGAFTLAGIGALLGFLIWLANLELDRQYDLYDILFDNVAGLPVGGDVFFNGVSVGQATAIDLYDENPAQVIVRVQVTAETPVKADTEVQLRPQGVTGLSFIEMTGGSPRADLLETNGGPVPVITAQPSIIDTLTQSAPDLLSQSAVLMNRLRDLLTDENVAHVTAILGNLDRASASLDTALAEVSGMTGTVSQATENLGDFTAELSRISPSLVTMLEAATTALGTADTTLDGANGVIREDVPGLVARTEALLGNLDETVTALRAEGPPQLRAVGGVAEAAGARLSELEATIRTLDQALVAATDTARSVRTLVDGDATGLVTDARGAARAANQALDTINGMLAADVTRALANVTEATETANAAMDRISADLQNTTRDLAPLIGNATLAFGTGARVFADASRTLGRIDTLAGDARGTLAAADTALGSANALLQSDLAPLASDLRESATRLTASAATVAESLPAITAQLRATLERADRVVAEIGDVVATAGPSVNTFAQRALPNIDAFASEARGLVASLERLTNQIQRDPTRFLLGTSLPEYRN